MKKILNIFFIAIVLCGGIIGITHACSSNQIDIGNGNCVDTKFTITTTNLNAGDEFKWYMSASGTFYVDCGSGGTLSGTGVTNNTITRNDTTTALYTCTYDTAGMKTIQYSGLATQYSTDGFYSQGGAIQFNCYGCNVAFVPEYIAAIDGSIGSIFPTLGQSDDLQPMFGHTFGGAQITSIPENLFDGIYGCRSQMFMQTFIGTQITSIPNNLFSGITCPATELFRNTFWGTQITSIPPDLFKNIVYSNDTSVLADMFFGTFCSCSNLTGYIPPALFAGLIEKGSPYGSQTMDMIFVRDSNLATTCPAGTTQYITGYESYWGGYVSCQKTNPMSCSAGTYLPKLYNNCSQCPANNYCIGGTYSFSASADQGINACAMGYSSGAGASSCTPNVINITWEDATPESVAANNAGSCTYGGTINTPAYAPTKRGYIFTGWSFD